MPSGGSTGLSRAEAMASGRPWAYSDSSVNDTYESTRSSPAATTAVCRARSRQTSVPSTMSATSALWPSTATGTTWSPSASADFTAASTSARSVAARDPAEQVQDAETGGRDERFSHGVDATAGHRRTRRPRWTDRCRRPAAPSTG